MDIYDSFRPAWRRRVLFQQIYGWTKYIHKNHARETPEPTPLSLSLFLARARANRTDPVNCVCISHFCPLSSSPLPLFLASSSSFLSLALTVGTTSSRTNEGGGEDVCYPLRAFVTPFAISIPRNRSSSFFSSVNPTSTYARRRRAIAEL